MDWFRGYGRVDISSNNGVRILVKKDSDIFSPETIAPLSRRGSRSFGNEAKECPSESDEDSDNCQKPLTREDKKAMEQRHRQLLYRTYLPVYLSAASADWLQGPYKYAVYSGEYIPSTRFFFYVDPSLRLYLFQTFCDTAYGYDQHKIAILFVAGFSSGMILGSVVGSLTDRVGRKRMACLYCCIYIVSCLAKHFRNFGVLLFGRVLGGIATSLLFSVFDSWLIKAHADRNIDKSFLSKSFSTANYGSSVVAILAGLLTNSLVGHAKENPLLPFFSSNKNHNWVTDIGSDEKWSNAILYKGGGIRAFDLALVPLIICGVLAMVTWDENYGNDIKQSSGNTTDKRMGSEIFASMKAALASVWRSPDVLKLCVVSSFVEGSMYVFIFHWTPTLRLLDIHPGESGHLGPPLGTVFATFMVCCMLGTSVFSIAISAGMSPSRVLVYVLSLSMISFIILCLSNDVDLSYGAMLIFEACIGAYWPAISTIKATIVPEDRRAAVCEYTAFLEILCCISCANASLFITM